MFKAEFIIRSYLYMQTKQDIKTGKCRADKLVIYLTVYRLIFWKVFISFENFLSEESYPKHMEYPQHHAVYYRSAHAVNDDRACDDEHLCAEPRNIALTFEFNRG